MLDIFIFFPTSPPSHLPISPSINHVKLIAMSNSDGFTPNHLLQQMSGTKVVDEDVNLEFSDEELELIADMPKSKGYAKSYDSDLFLDSSKIMSYNEFSQVMRSYNDHQEIAFIQDRFSKYGANISLLVAGVIWNNLRDTAPILIKRAHRGFTVDLNTGQLRYIQ